MNAVAQVLDLREGEGRTLAFMSVFVFLNTANTTLLSAAKNGLFLSVYPGSLIPHAIIAAAFVTAVVAIIFAGVIAGTARRGMAIGLSLVIAVSLVVSRAAFEVNDRSAFALYLWLSAVQVLLITHCWDYVGDLLTGRQAKRLLPLIGIGASFGAILGGFAIAPLAPVMGTSNLLLVAAALALAALPLLWAVPEPVREPDEDVLDASAVRAFVSGASRGFRSIGSEKLLRLLAVGLVMLTLTGTLIDLQLKLVLQEQFTRDRITAIYGLMSASVGTGTLILQLVASRFLFPRLGVSFAALLQGSALALASAGVAVWGGFLVLAAAQVVDDVFQHSLQKPVEQISLLPFPGPLKSTSLATLNGVLRPLSKAAAGGLALALGASSGLLPIATVVAAVGAVLAYLPHRRLYLGALERALSRHTVDLTRVARSPLVVDRESLAVLDRSLADRDPMVVVFATSLLAQLPLEDALPRCAALLQHPAPEVRAESALVLTHLDLPPGSRRGAAEAIEARLALEESPLVLRALLDAAGSVWEVTVEAVWGFTRHPDPAVRRAGLVALGRLGEDLVSELREKLRGEDTGDRIAAAGAAGDLALAELIPQLAAAVDDDPSRPAALDALARLGPEAVPVMARLLRRRCLPLPARRSVVTALASVPGPEARDALLELVGEPALGPAAMTSLLRMRNAARVEPIDPEVLRPVLEAEIRKGVRFSLVASALRQSRSDARAAFVAAELEDLRARTVHRALRILSLSYDPARLSTVAAALLSDDPARHSNALELLEGTISSASGPAVIPFLEATADGFGSERAADLFEDVDLILSRPAEALAEDEEWWPRSLALHVLGRDAEITTPGRDPDAPDEDDPMIPLIEKVMVLKGSQLFRRFPGTDLAGIAALASVVRLSADEIVFRQGDDGDAFYMVVQGSVRISRGAHELALLGPREGFGEMAILDQETRSATATAAEPTTLLRIDRDSFDRLIEQNPAIARGIYRVLTERLRNTLAQVASG